MTKILSALALALTVASPFMSANVLAVQKEAFSIEQYANDLDLMLPIIGGMQSACLKDKKLSCETPEAFVRLIMQYAATNPSNVTVHPGNGVSPRTEAEQVFIDKMTEHFIIPDTYK